MASNRTLFPFPPLPEGEVTPWPGPGDRQELLQRDVRIARWFIKERWGRKFNPASSLGHLLTLSEQLDLRGPTKTVDELDREVARHGLHLSAALVRLAWAVRALHGNGGAVDHVDGSFIDDEVMGEDTKQPDAERRLPGGIGTLVFAGRLVQAGGGRILSINGKGVPGHDIRWVTKLGDTVLVEQKDRSYEAGLGDTPEKRIKRDRGHTAGLLEVFGGGAVPLDDLPHVVIVEHLGLEPETGRREVERRRSR